MPPNSRDISDVAAETEYTVEQLNETANDIEQAVQSNLTEHYERCHLYGDRNYWLLESTSGIPGAYLAFSKYDLYEQLRDAEIEFDADMVEASATAYLRTFHRHGLTIATPGIVAKNTRGHVYYPIFVAYPDDWRRGEHNTFQRFQESVMVYDMSPAEALDYWAIERMNKEPHQWARFRGVDPEAVRKNVRQARSKREEKPFGDTHERGTIRAVPLDELPEDGPYDEEEDMYYQPDDEVAERWNE